ncbi:transporter substrate-binding domain-containing protein [Burkholderia aenigmatica]|uniref:Amino acid ABC transporter substrate-binding protein n=1 Tax=Burkholderia aenigmatica TaxID=2015348 RepID=A0A228J298_9BURK|nr:transporter substrate-binding domain-containing protein [Burkholderia aenigmatica]OXI48694.1 amino acid ABC transporter substrate-binding protein [Burkholderia aenigmatica]
MKVRIAYIEEPPFYWTAEDGAVTGADIELAEVVLRAIGVTDIEYHPTSFDALLPGVQAGRWDMNVPIFVTAERARHVAFSVPVWAIGDGFVLQAGNPKRLTSYAAVAARSDARLGCVTDQVQIDSAKAAGVSDGQIVIFKDQADAVAALLAGQVDAFASTAIGARAVADTDERLTAVSHELGAGAAAPVGGFSFSKNSGALVQAVNAKLREYLGSADHRERTAKYGFTRTEIDGVVENGGAQS